MQTPWSHQVVREEFDEEIRLLIASLNDKLIADTASAPLDDTPAPQLLVDHAHRTTLWSLAALYLSHADAQAASTKARPSAAQHYTALHDLYYSGATEGEPNDATRSGSTPSPTAQPTEHSRPHNNEQTLIIAEALAHAAVAGIDGALDDLRHLLRDKEKHWWDPRHGLIRTAGGAHHSAPFDLGSNVYAIGVFLLASDVTGERIWADRARFIAHALHQNLPPTSLIWATVLHPDDAHGEQRHAATHAHPRATRAVLDAEQRTRIYFLWVRNLLHLRARIIEDGDEAPEWMLHDAWQIYRWIMATSWPARADGFTPLIQQVVQPSAAQLSPLVEAVSATEALGKTIEYDEGRDEWLAQLSADFALAMTWADTHLRQSPGQWRNTTARGHSEVSEEADSHEGALAALLSALMLARLPLTPSLPVSLEEGYLAPLRAAQETG
ncbi:AGE family epimerase/isomerase [Schaalia canis]|nr:AGE family epimerase/isomerase [Schaalia canis]